MRRVGAHATMGQRGGATRHKGLSAMQHGANDGTTRDGLGEALDCAGALGYKRAQKNKEIAVCRGDSQVVECSIQTEPFIPSFER